MSEVDNEEQQPQESGRGFCPSNSPEPERRRESPELETLEVGPPHVLSEERGPRVGVGPHAH